MQLARLRNNYNFAHTKITNKKKYNWKINDNNDWNKIKISVKNYCLHIIVNILLNTYDFISTIVFCYKPLKGLSYYHRILLRQFMSIASVCLWKCCNINRFERYWQLIIIGIHIQPLNRISLSVIIIVIPYTNDVGVVVDPMLRRSKSIITPI